MQVSVTSDRSGGVLTVAVSGEVDLASAPDVEQAIADALRTDGVTTVQVDLSGVRFLDSSGIALLLRGRRDADERAVGYRVTGVRGIAKQVLELTGVLAHLSSGPTGTDGQ